MNISDQEPLHFPIKKHHMIPELSESILGVSQWGLDLLQSIQTGDSWAVFFIYR